MLNICFYLFLFTLQVLEVENTFDYKIDYRKPYSPGHVCNYEVYHLKDIEYVLYTCVPANKCAPPSFKYLRRPELHYDNCNFAFHPHADGHPYVCCHPQDNEDTLHNPNATLAPLQTRFMPGFRTGFKCKEYSKLACIDETMCVDKNSRREVKGGTTTSSLKYPHVAIIGWLDEKNEEQSWFCLGSIVTERFVLTAATCREDKDGHFASRVRVGEDVLCDILVNCDTNEDSQLLVVDKQIHHPKSYLAYFYHDLMLLRVTTDIVFNARVRPACIFREMNTTLGGGMFPLFEDPDDEPKQFQTLHEMNIQGFSKRVCNQHYASSHRLVEPEVDEEILFCAGLPQVDKEPCAYDYGGALVDMSAERGRPRCVWEIYGVMSWSQDFQQCRTKLPPMFTRVSFYLEWIESTIWPTFEMLKEHSRLPEQCMVPVAAASTASRETGRCTG